MSISIYDQSRIQLGLDILLRQDAYLLKNITSERSITHKLGEHYQFVFNEWNVDCEFNRNLGDPKTIEIDPEVILSQMAEKLADKGHILDMLDLGDNRKVVEELENLEKQLKDPRNIDYTEELGVAFFTLTLVNGKKLKKAIYPDIIIYHRGTKDNHIVIECKKSINKDPRDRAYDLIKLITLATSSNFMYRAGYFIDIPVGDEFAHFEQFSVPYEFAKNVYVIRPQYQ